MTKKPFNFSLPGFDQALGRWRADYGRQIGTDRDGPQPLGHRDQAALHAARLGRLRLRADLGFPGQYPFTRGIYPTMHRGRTWTQRQLIGLGTPEDYNERVRIILDAGATAISFLPCNSGFRGVDCDEVDPLLLGTCGTVSTRPTTWISALDGVPLGRISTAMNDPSPVHAARFHARRRQTARHPLVADLRHVEPERLHFAFHRQSHVLSAVAARARGACCSIISSSAAARAGLESGVRRRPAHAAGGRDAGRDHGLHDLHRAAICRKTASSAAWTSIVVLRRFTFFFDISISFFEEIAKFRAGAAHLGAAGARTARRKDPGLLALQVPRPDVGRRSHRAAAAQQHRARRRAGDGRDHERAAIPAYRRL